VASGPAAIDLSDRLTLSGTTHTNAGTYTGDAWSFAGGVNYIDASGTIDNSIAKGTATITITPYITTYDGNSHTATAVATGAGNIDLSGDLTISSTTHTNAGTYLGDAWSFVGGENYHDASGTVDNSIAKATVTITFTPYTSAATIYDGNSHTATGVAKGAGNIDLSENLTLSGTTHTNAGTYLGDVWSFSGGENYNDASGTVDNSIAKRTATITITPYNRSFDGILHSASATATGVGNVDLISSLDLTGTRHTNAGLYNNDPWSFHDVTGNYLDASGTIVNTIGSAPVISTQPVNVSVLAGATASFMVVATGDPEPTIQWQVSTNHGSSWSDILNATAATYSLSTVMSNGGYQYRAVLTNPVGVITSGVATLTVNSRSFSTSTTYTTTVLAGFSTGSIHLVDIVDPEAISMSTTYTATINWGDGHVDTNVAVSHPDSDGVTIRVRGNHVYSAGGNYQPLITLFDAAGSAFTTVLGNTAKLTVGTNVSSQVKITRSSPVKNRTTGMWAQTVTINNSSGVDLTGNVDFVLIGLTAGVSLENATGSIADGAASYIRFSTRGLKAGKSISLVLNFLLPTTMTSFNYSFKTFTN
jgi:hypothetical protein